MSSNAHRTRAWPAPAMRGGKGLVQVVMHHIEPDIAGPDDPQQRVQVGAISIDQTARRMHQADDVLHHVLVKKAERVRVGQHQTCEGVVAFGRQRFQVYIAAGQILARPRACRSWQTSPGSCRGQSWG